MDHLRTTEHFKPRLNQLLHTLRVGVTYERGQGDFLYCRDEHGTEIEVLDLVGGYGSLLLGHAHPTLVAEAGRLLAAGRPAHAQGSIRACASNLAAMLSLRAQGDYCVLFGNSGAEAVELAMKHALLESGGRTFIALERAFHGKTLGAVQLTASPSHRESFELAGLNVTRVAVNDLDQLDTAFARARNLAGFVFEPILGEGGVRPVEPAFAQHAAQLCAERGVPFIADECQTGLGRTGTFLACEQLGVQPDYITLSKSLGGGLAKISATLISRKRYQDRFDLMHGSTYADDDFSCAIALKTLELIDDDLMLRCQAQGDRLIARLQHLAGRYPAAIAAVRGRGLMIGLEFRRPSPGGSFLLRYLGAQEDLVLVIMGYLLNTHRIRVAPTLSDRFTLRLEPSALLDDPAIHRVLTALDDVCARLVNDDVAGLTRFLAQEPRTPTGGRLRVRSDPKFLAYEECRVQPGDRAAPRLKAGWLCQLVDTDDLVKLDPAFGAWSAKEREDLLDRLAPRIAPVLMGTSDILSANGATVRFYPILLPFTSRWIKRQIDARQLAAPQALVQMGVDLARSLGCQTVSLGQYTSIVTRNGLEVDANGMGLTTGNSYSIALALQAIEQAHRQTATHSATSTLVIVGAAGNIGRTCAQIMAPRYRRTILVGSDKPGAWLRLRESARGLPNAMPTTDPAAITEGDVVIATLNAVDAPLGSARFAHHAIVCDISVPTGLRPGLAADRPDLLVIKGGIASLPNGEDLGIVGFPLPRGQVYGCMAEALLLGFAGVRDATFTGSLSARHVRRVSELAQQHGFGLADYKQAGVLGFDLDRTTHPAIGSGVQTPAGSAQGELEPKLQLEPKGCSDHL